MTITELVFGLLATTGVLTFLLIILLLPLFLSKNARTFFINFFRKKPIVLVVTSNLNARFLRAKYEHGLLKAGNLMFFVTPQSSYQSEGYTVSIAYDRFASVLPYKSILYAQKLRDLGIENLDEAKERGVDIELKLQNNDLRGETLRVQDIIRLFQYELNPSFINATLEKIEAELRLGLVRRIWRQQYVAFGMMILFILVGLGMLFYLFSGGKGFPHIFKP